MSGWAWFAERRMSARNEPGVPPVEGLDEIIIRAGVEARTRSAVASRAVSINTGVARFFAETIEDRPAIEAREHDIENDGVVRRFLGLGEPSSPASAVSTA